MSSAPHEASSSPADRTGGHPSQAEGEDPAAESHPDPRLDGHPSQAEGAPDGEAKDDDEEPG